MSFVYLGPTIDELSLVKNRIYRCNSKQELNILLARAINLFPTITRLIVEVDALHEAEIRLKRSGTPENLALQDIYNTRNRRGEINGSI